MGPSSTATYTYDTLNHLTQIVQGGSTLATYSYNGVGQRVCKVAGGVTSNYLWDGNNLAQENRGGTFYIYSYLGSNPIAMTSGGSSQAFETDALGTVLGVVNSSGTEIARYTTDDFGVSQGQSGASNNPFRFGGAFYDSESGLCQMRGRYYDPSLGRFLTVDINPGNPYSYCGNNPVSRTDPSGWGGCNTTAIVLVDGGNGLLVEWILWQNGQLFGYKEASHLAVRPINNGLSTIPLTRDDIVKAQEKGKFSCDLNYGMGCWFLIHIDDLTLYGDVIHATNQELKDWQSKLASLGIGSAGGIASYYAMPTSLQLKAVAAIVSIISGITRALTSFISSLLLPNIDFMYFCMSNGKLTIFLNYDTLEVFPFIYLQYEPNGIFYYL